MTPETRSKTSVVPGRFATVLSRILEEGYGEGAWHGPDLETALEDVSPETALQRPGPGRHNIAEIALHHAWYLRLMAERIGGRDSTPFLLEGEDWFELDGERGPGWADVQGELASRQEELAEVVRDLEGDEARLTDAQTFERVLGITCHAAYHAGQIQLIKRLFSG